MITINKTDKEISKILELDKKIGKLADKRQNAYYKICALQKRYDYYANKIAELQKEYNELTGNDEDMGYCINCENYKDNEDMHDLEICENCFNNQYDGEMN